MADFSLLGQFQKNIHASKSFDFTVSIFERETINLILLNIQNGMYDIKLLNSNGILLKETHQYFNPLEVMHPMNLSNLNLAKGVYFISITDFNGNKKTKKILLN